jgi:uncharacterized protein (TIGR02284 family)
VVRSCARRALCGLNPATPLLGFIRTAQEIVCPFLQGAKLLTAVQTCVRHAHPFLQGVEQMSSREFLPEQKVPFDLDKTLGTIEKLIDACRDGEAGYRDAAEHITDSTLRAYFQQQSLERARFAAELHTEMERLGKWEQTHQGTLAGNVERTWFDVKRALGGDDAAILEAVEAGEDRAKAAYEDALKQPLPAEVQGLVRSQAQTVFAAHDHARNLRDKKKAA